MSKLEISAGGFEVIKNRGHLGVEIVLKDCDVTSLVHALETWVYKATLFKLLKDDIIDWIMNEPNVYAELLGTLDLDENETFSLNKAKIFDWIESDPELIKEFKDKLNNL